MLYFLLIIIAIGVLLASEDGQKFLLLLIKIAIFAGGAYLAFWIVVLAIGLLSDKELRDNILTVLGTIMFIGYAGYGVYVVYKKHQRGEYTLAKTATGLKNIGKGLWKQNPKIIIFLALAYSFIAILIIYGLITNGFQ